jgi:hypothetical protein
MTQGSFENKVAPAALEREIAHMRQAISTAKFVASITAAIAATFVAGTLQVDPQTHWDHAAAILMAITLGITFSIVWLRPKPHLRELDEDDVEVVEKQARRAHWLMLSLVAFSGLSCVAATLGLLWPGSWQ